MTAWSCFASCVARDKKKKVGDEEKKRSMNGCV